MSVKGDFVENVVVPLRLGHPSAIVAGALAPHGDLYLMMEDGCLLRFEYSSAGWMDLGGAGDLPRSGMIKTADGTVTCQLSVDRTRIFVLFPAGVFV